MQQIADDREERRLLAAMLGSGGRESRPDLPFQGTFRPQAAGLVEERRHLRGHPTISGARAHYDRVIILQLRDRRDRSRLVQLEISSTRDILRYGFGHTLDVN